MTKLEIDNQGNDRGGFMHSQFRPPASGAQTVFDVLFGVVAPILCFYFDPGILRSSGFILGVAPAIFPQYAGFIYSGSAIEILLLIAWLVCGRRLETAAHLAGGMLMAGAIFSALIGIVLLPFTMLGLTIGIGVFGFVPFLTALVYLRNARSAFRLAAKPAETPETTKLSQPARGMTGLRRPLLATLAGGVLALGPPAALSAAASMFVSQAMDAVLTADEQQAELAIDEIRYLQFFAQPELDRLVSAYSASSEPSRREVLKQRYLKLTGDDIERRLAILND